MIFAELGIELEWQGKGENEKGIVKSIHIEKLHSFLLEINKGNGLNTERLSLTAHNLINDVVVKVNLRYYRPTEVELLIGNPGKAKKYLGWEAKTKIEDLVKIMIKSDFEKIKANNLQ